MKKSRWSCFFILNSSFELRTSQFDPICQTRLALPTMARQLRSEQSRRQVLDAALQLFSHQGFRATAVREIADAAGVSTGNLYHHFPDKEAIFRTLLDEFSSIAESRRYPLTRALTGGSFPDNLEQIGSA